MKNRAKNLHVLLAYYPIKLTSLIKNKKGMNKDFNQFMFSQSSSFKLRIIIKKIENRKDWIINKKKKKEFEKERKE